MQRGDGIGNGRQQLISNVDGLRRDASGFGRVGGHDRDRLADVTHAPAREHRLVEFHESEALASGQLGGRDHSFDPGQTLRGRNVDAGDPCVRMGTAQRRAEEHSLAIEVASVAELAFHLRHGVGSLERLADAAPNAPTDWSDAHRRYIAAEERCTASRIFP